MRALLLLTPPLLLLAACAPRASEASAPLPRRAIWVTRWDYRTRADVERIVADVAAAGFDTLLFQVRGNASVFYPSELEPWAAELGGLDPGFDPLAVALARAREEGLRLHAWFNLIPAWWGATPPVDPAHVLNTHPDWLWVDQHGERQSMSAGFYVSLNPCLPEVRAYLVEVARELLERYEVDGLHLDYARFPNEPPAARADQDFPRDARTLALYRSETGRAPDDDAAAWDAWRAGCVTELVRDLRSMQLEVRPRALLTAALGPEPELAARHFQDWPTWLDEGLLDAAFPMNYTADPERFAARLEAWRAWEERVPVVMGLMLAPLEAGELLRRSRLALSDFTGVAWFGYLELWDSANDVIATQSRERSAERARRRAALSEFLSPP